MTATTPLHHPDELRRFAIQLLIAAGLPPDQAAELAGHLIWFDLVGRPEHGLATLPPWLTQLAAGEVDPKASPRFGSERLGTAVLEAGRGPAVLALRVAARAAANKAREAGTALVRLRGVDRPIGPATPIVAELAAGPLAAAILGWDGSWSLAAPTAGGPPAVADPALNPPTNPPPSPWAALLEPGDWIVLAVAVPALESLSALAARFLGRSNPPGDAWCNPDDWNRRRSAAFEQGLRLDDATFNALLEWARRLGVAHPATSQPTTPAGV